MAHNFKLILSRYFWKLIAALTSRRKADKSKLAALHLLFERLQKTRPLLSGVGRGKNCTTDDDRALLIIQVIWHQHVHYRLYCHIVAIV